MFIRQKKKSKVNHIIPYDFNTCQIVSTRNLLHLLNNIDSPRQLFLFHCVAAQQLLAINKAAKITASLVAFNSFYKDFGKFYACCTSLLRIKLIDKTY